MKKIAVGDLGEFWYGDYKEPFEQLEGGVPGHPVGVVLKADDGKLLCAYCGKTYDNLGRHVATHGMNARGYKEEVGLLFKSALVSERRRFQLVRGGRRSFAALRAEGKFKPFQKGSGGQAEAVQTGESHWQRRGEALNQTGRCYSQVLAVAKMLSAKGRLSKSQLSKHGIGRMVVSRYFGDMDALARMVGSRPKRWTDQELVAGLRNLANDIGRTPIASDLRRFGMPNIVTYRKHFGSWNKAVLAAGLFPTTPMGTSIDDEIAMLVAYATTGSLIGASKSLHVSDVRLRKVLLKYGFPYSFSDPIQRQDRRAWAQEMASRLSGEMLASAA